MGFFYLALPPGVPCLTLEEFHELVTSLWIPRHDEAIKAEETIRRKGRPRSTREDALREQKQRDIEEYRTGLGTTCRRTLTITLTSSLRIA